MTIAFHKGRYGVRLAQSAEDVDACQRLRHLCFLGRPGIDAEPFDDGCTHIMVAGPDGLVATSRVLMMSDGKGVDASYAAQRYDLKCLLRVDAPLLELGRFCVLPGVNDPDVVRLAWGALTRMVDDAGAAMLFGCASFKGCDPSDHRAAFSLLADRFQAPASYQIARKAVQTFALSKGAHDHAKAMGQVPPLLRSYLSMGGWVSDHAVIDRDMNTMHVFCGVEIAKIPPARAKALRAVAS